MYNYVVNVVITLWFGSLALISDWVYSWWENNPLLQQWCSVEPEQKTKIKLPSPESILT
jgi:hypothetical protein